jgi:hypothetical protein
METPRAIEILRTLADGRDPVTGQPFPPSSPYQQADTVRALYVALEALSSSAASALAPQCAHRSTAGAPREKTPRRPIDPNHPKAGGPWSPDEEQQLRDAFAAQQPIPEIATAHGRTAGAITARLVKLGLLDPSAADHPGMPRRTTSPPTSSIRQNHPIPSSSSTQLTREEKDNLPF